MAGSLTLGGMAAGLLAGEVVVGPSTVAGKEANTEIINVTLAANVDTSVPVPTGAVQWAVFFPFEGSSPAEVKVGSNLVATASGMPVPALGFASAGVTSTVTELKFKSAVPPSTFQVVFI